MRAYFLLISRYFCVVIFLLCNIIALGIEMMTTRNTRSPLNSKTKKIEIHSAKFSKLMKQKVYKQTLLTCSIIIRE